eukprot:196339_1
MDMKLLVAINTATIKDIKNMIIKTDKISIQNEEAYALTLHFRNKQLNHDNKTLIDYNIKDGDTLNYFIGNDLVIKILNSDIFSIKYKSNDTILSVKQYIQDLKGISVGALRIVFNGKLLENDKSLLFYNIGKGSILHCAVALRWGTPPDNYM